jgi:hypothetical protein
MSASNENFCAFFHNHERIFIDCEFTRSIQELMPISYNFKNECMSDKHDNSFIINEIGDKKYFQGLDNINNISLIINDIDAISFFLDNEYNFSHLWYNDYIDLYNFYIELYESVTL